MQLIARATLLLALCAAIGAFGDGSPRQTAHVSSRVHHLEPLTKLHVHRPFVTESVGADQPADEVVLRFSAFALEHEFRVGDVKAQRVQLVCVACR